MTSTPSPLVAALEHAVAVLRSLNAARGLAPREHGRRWALLDRAIAQQSALMRSLNAAYEELAPQTCTQCGDQCLDYSSREGKLLCICCVSTDSAVAEKALSACWDIWGDYSADEVRALPPSVQSAWNVGLMHPPKAKGAPHDP